MHLWQAAEVADLTLNTQQPSTGITYIVGCSVVALVACVRRCKMARLVQIFYGAMNALAGVMMVKFGISLCSGADECRELYLRNARPKQTAFSLQTCRSSERMPIHEHAEWAKAKGRIHSDRTNILSAKFTHSSLVSTRAQRIKSKPDALDQTRHTVGGIAVMN